MSTGKPVPVQAITNIVNYNWTDEERDYSTEALIPGNSRLGHIFKDLMQVQEWLESAHGVTHREPQIDQPDVLNADLCDECYEALTGLHAVCQDYCSLPLSHQGLCDEHAETSGRCQRCFAAGRLTHVDES